METNNEIKLVCCVGGRSNRKLSAGMVCVRGERWSPEMQPGVIILSTEIVLMLLLGVRKNSNGFGK